MKKLIFITLAIAILFTSSCDSTHTVSDEKLSSSSSILFGPQGDCGGSICF